MEISKVIAVPLPYEECSYTTFVDSLQALSDGRFLSINSPYIEVYDPKTGISNLKFFGYKATEIPDKNQLILAGPGGYVRVCDLKEGKELSRFLVHEDGIYNIIHVKENVFASCSSDRSVCVWDVENLKILHKFRGHTDNVSDLILLPDDRIASSSWDNTIRIWNMETSVCDIVFDGFKDQYMRGGIRMKVLPIIGDAYLILSSHSGKLKAWDPRDKKCIHEYEEKNLHLMIPWTQNRFITNGNDGNINIFSVFGGERETIKLHGKWIAKAKLIDENTLLTCSSDSTLKIYDLSKGKALQTLEYHKKEVNCFAQLRGGEIVSGSLDGTIVIWKMPNKLVCSSI